MDSYAVTLDDVDAVLEGHSFARIRATELFMAAGLAAASAFLFFFFRIRGLEGDALMEEISWLMPVLTLVQALLAAWLWRRDRVFALTYWETGGVDPAAVAALGWRSAPQRTPTEVVLLLFEAWSLLRLAGWALLALVSLGILGLGAATSDLMHAPIWWINAAGLIYWVYLLTRLYPTRAHVHRWFQHEAAMGADSVGVLAGSDAA